MPTPPKGADLPDPTEHHQALQAPWRMEYLEDPSGEALAPSKPGGSFLARYWEDPSSDRANHVVHRSQSGMLLLNRYPYASGHLLVAMGEARPSLLDYDPAQRAALWELVELGVGLVQRALRPQGVNIGINQGRASGAGVPEHLHAHVVPRWSGDTNFMQVVGRVRVLPATLEMVAERYRQTLRMMIGPTA